MIELTGKRIVVLGAGESGVQSAFFLKRKGASVFLSELKKASEFGDLEQRLKDAGISCEFGIHTWNRIIASELVIMSPGISPQTAIHKEIEKSGIPMWSEIELAYHFCKGKIIAVTGTNGKTTVTSLIQELLQAEGKQVISCGNIGNSFIREIDRITEDTVVVLEVSSFQLNHVEQFKPYIAILLNVSANHYDWHGGHEAYIRAKCRIFSQQTDRDVAVIHEACRDVVEKMEHLAANVVYFNHGAEANPNHVVVKEIANLFQISSDTVETVIRNFKGIAHRLEKLGTYQGIQYINDSKSTTLASLAWALKHTPGQIVLIVGGRSKGGDFRTLRELVKQKTRISIKNQRYDQTQD